ncbi:MAG: hypothetical protein ACRCTW_07745 [Lactococcus garvieae]
MSDFKTEVLKAYEDAHAPQYYQLKEHLLEAASCKGTYAIVKAHHFNLSKEQLFKWCEEEGLSVRDSPYSRNQNWIEISWKESVVTPEEPDEVTTGEVEPALDQTNDRLSPISIIILTFVMLCILQGVLYKMGLL